MISNYKIYGLVVSNNNEIRYIGYTKRSLEQRLYSHLVDAKNGLTYRKCNWIRKHNYNIDIILIEDNLSYEDALKREVYYISKYDNLTNMTLGGEENPMNNPLVKAKHAEKMKSVKNPHYGSDNWMTTDKGKEWFTKNNPMNNPIHIEKHRMSMSKFKKVIDKDILYRLYITEGKKLTEVAEELETTYRSVIKNLKNYAIKKYNCNGD